MLRQKQQNKGDGPHKIIGTVPFISTVFLSLATCLVIGLAYLVGCEEPSATVITGEAMGTRYHVTLGPQNSAADAIDADIAELLDAIEDEASQWRSASWVTRFNASRSRKAFDVPGHVWAMLVVAERVHRDSGGALDITVGPLVGLWGFGAEPAHRPPSDSAVAQVLDRCGMDKLVLNHDAQTVSKLKPTVTIDLSALAKGYAVDRIADLLDARGITDYLIAFGGDVRAKGDGPAGEGWIIGIGRADGNSDAASEDRIALMNKAVATSGGGQQQHGLPDGQTVTHLIDPRTGRPVTDATLSVTVLADRAVLADAWATALSVTPPPQRDTLAERGGVQWIDSR